jgi:predicted nucleotidyltransferase
MIDIRQKIIREIVEEKKKNPKVVAILLFGSMARGNYNEKSDIDIEIICDGINSREEVKEKRYGIDIDFELWPKDKLIKRIDGYPFLSYPYIEEKILFDPTGLVEEIKRKLNSYFKEHAEVLRAWKMWERDYLESKKLGKKTKSVKEFYDELEIKFSKKHKISRNF